MTHALFFVQGCPTCGRKVQIRIEHLGKVVTCHHCRATFMATDGFAREDALEDFPFGSRTQSIVQRMGANLSSPWPFAPPDGR